MNKVAFVQGYMNKESAWTDMGMGDLKGFQMVKHDRRVLLDKLTSVMSKLKGGPKYQVLDDETADTLGRLGYDTSKFDKALVYEGRDLNFARDQVAWYAQNKGLNLMDINSLEVLKYLAKHKLVKQEKPDMNKQAFVRGYLDKSAAEDIKTEIPAGYLPDGRNYRRESNIRKLHSKTPDFAALDETAQKTFKKHLKDAVIPSTPRRVSTKDLQKEVGDSVYNRSNAGYRSHSGYYDLLKRLGIKPGTGGTVKQPKLGWGESPVLDYGNVRRQGKTPAETLKILKGKGMTPEKLQYIKNLIDKGIITAKTDKPQTAGSVA